MALMFAPVTLVTPSPTMDSAAQVEDNAFKWILSHSFCFVQMMMSADWALTLVLTLAMIYKAPILVAAVKDTYWIQMDVPAMV